MLHTAVSDGSLGAPILPTLAAKFYHPDPTPTKATHYGFTKEKDKKRRKKKTRKGKERKEKKRKEKKRKEKKRK